MILSSAPRNALYKKEQVELQISAKRHPVEKPEFPGLAPQEAEIAEIGTTWLSVHERVRVRAKES